MTPPAFPTLPGQGWSVHKKPTFSTLVASHVSGREVRDALYQNPIWQFEATFDGLSSGSTDYPGLGAQSLQSLMGLYLQLQGQFGTFLYTDPTDNSAMNQTISTGDGSTTNFVFARTLGAFLEPVGWVTGIFGVYLNGLTTPSAGLPPPAGPALSHTAGGSLAASTYFVRTTYVTASGETFASSEGSLALASGQLLVVASPPAPSPASAIGWNVYIATSTGAETKQNAATPIAIGANWTAPASGLLAGQAPPTANTTGWALTGPATLSFARAPATGAVISSSFAYAFLCRFDDDALDFNQVMANLWQVDSVKFRSVRTS
jgi:hypothetical protein